MMNDDSSNDAKLIQNIKSHIKEKYIENIESIMSELKDQDMKKFVSRADFGGIISLDTSKRLKIETKKDPGELP